MKEKIIPFDLETAAAVQSGKKKGFITRTLGENRLTLMTLTGTSRHMLFDDTLEKVEDVNEDTPRHFVIRLLVADDIPGYLAGKKSFHYLGHEFIGAGRFGDLGISSDFKSISSRLRLDHNVNERYYAHADFYHFAATRGYGEDDIFWCVDAGIYVCPCSNFLFEIQI